MIEHEHKPSLSEVLGNKEFPAKQIKAIKIIDNFTLSPEQKRLLFLYHLWHESGTIVPIKKLTGIKNNADAFSLIGKVLESDELVEQYDNFYKQYRTIVKDGE